MDAEKFIETLNQKIAVIGTNDMVQDIKYPSGRSPKKWRSELSEWILSLNKTDRKFVERLIAESREAAIFEILATFDGVNRFTEELGDFQIKFIEESGEESIISVGNFSELHDMFNSIRPHSPNKQICTIKN